MGKFLVIQQKMIGDVLASTIICEHLKTHFPKSEVHYVINESTVAVVEGNPYVDEIILFEKRFKTSKPAFFQFLKEIKKEEYDAVLDVYCKLESNLISYFANAPIKISYKKWYSKFIYTHLFSYSQNPNTKVGLAIENKLLLLKPIVGKLEKPELAPKIFLSRTELQHAKNLLEKHEIDTSKKILMLGVLGSSANKSYPINYLASLINMVVQKFDVEILLNYIPNQKKEVEEFLNLCSPQSRDRIHEELFCTSLREVLALLSQCDGYIGNEGGMSNMSKALDIPNFSIFSPWISKKGWLTFNDNSANRAVHLEDYFEGDLNSIPKKKRKKKSGELYQKFKPSYIEKGLFAFLDEEVFSDQ